MQYCVDHPEEISKLAKVKAHVSKVKGVMMENIEKVHLGISFNDLTYDCFIDFAVLNFGMFPTMPYFIDFVQNFKLKLSKKGANPSDLFQEVLQLGVIALWTL